MFLLRSFMNEVAQWVKPEEERRISDFELSVVIAVTNGTRNFDFDFLKDDDTFGYSRFTKKDLFKGGYIRLEYKIGKTGEWSNDVSAIPAANEDLKALFESTIITSGGNENMVDGLMSSSLESEYNHQGTIEAGPRDRALINPFVIEGDGEFTGVIKLPKHFGTDYSVTPITDATQVYVRLTFKGLRMRNYAHDFESVNWSTSRDFLDSLEADAMSA